MKSLYEIPIKQLDGTETTLAPFAGQVLLIVNVASRCGFTRQYQALEALYQTYHADGLQVLGFPCNQFLRQEPGDSQSIHAFTQSCFRITFPLFEKIDVKGPHQSPLYAYLASHIQKKPWVFIPWNFSKILVSPKGEVLRQFSPFTAPEKITPYIKQLLHK